jgi:uncharacterized protein (TIGR03435 family)
MLQTLLADHFQLKYHRKDNESRVYLLLKRNKVLELQGAKKTMIIRGPRAFEGAQ